MEGSTGGGGWGGVRGRGNIHSPSVGETGGEMGEVGVGGLVYPLALSDLELTEGVRRGRR